MFYLVRCDTQKNPPHLAGRLLTNITQVENSRCLAVHILRNIFIVTNMIMISIVMTATIQDQLVCPLNAL